MKLNLFKIFYLLTLLFIKGFAFGQTKTINIEFEKDKLTGISQKSTCKKDFVIKVDGINTALHKVAVKFDDFYWFTETPEALKTVLPNIAVTNPKPLGNMKDGATDVIQYIKNAIAAIENFNDTVLVFYSTKPAGYLNDIQIVATTIVEDVEKLEVYMNYFTGYYEALLEMSKSTYNVELAQTIGESRDLYLNLQSNRKNLISGANTIEAASKKLSGTSFISKVHTFSKPVTTVQIYVINKFDLDDTIAVYEEDIYRDGKITLDFSTGVGLNSLVKPQYYIGDNGAGKFIGNERTRELDFSVIALLHLNVRVFSWLSIGPATGVSVSAFDGNTGYLYGGTISIGKQRSFSISAGGILGKTVALSKTISSDGNSADLTLPTDISSVPTYDKIGKGGFISFTYNLTRIRKKD